jgi:membrane dipeptidase
MNAEFGLTTTGGRGGRGGRGAPESTSASCPVEDAKNPPAPRGGGRNRGNAAVEALSPERHADYNKKSAEIDAKWPAAGRATVKDFVNHIDHAVD